MIIDKIVVGQLQTNCYLISDSSECLIVDPGDDADYIINKISDLNVRPILIIATHGHFDHVLAVSELKLAYNIPFMMHEADLPIVRRQKETAAFFLKIKVDPPPAVDRYIKEGDLVKLGKSALLVLETPGHTAGSVCLLEKKTKIIFTGDTLFKQGTGRTDLEGGSRSKLIESLKKKILTLPSDYLVYSGHGPETTIGCEKAVLANQ